MAAERREALDIRGAVSPRERDRALATWAANKHRVAALGDLLRFGFSRQQIERRIADGRLVRRYRGVYVVGPGALNDHGEWLAATLFAGSDAVLSGPACAANQRLADWNGGRIDVTAPRRISPPGRIRAHRRHLPPDEMTIANSIPSTTTGRTILDCASLGAMSRDVERMLEEAFVHKIPIRPPLAELLARYPRQRGVAAARDALRKFAPGRTLTKSDLEELLLAFVDRSRLPRPLMNHVIETRVGRIRLDCAWPALRYAVELDAPSTHGSRPSMLSDRRRDRALRAIGWRVDRLMEEDVLDEATLLADFNALLGP